MGEFPITLTYSYFGSPGSSGVSRLSISLTSEGDLSVVDDIPSEFGAAEEDVEAADPAFLPDEFSEDQGYRRSTVLPASAGWRGVIDYLAANEIMAFITDGDTEGEYPWPDSMKIKGSGSIASDLIATAWSGAPLLEIAQALAQLPDAALETLRARRGSLCGAAVIQPLLRIWNRAQELDVPFDAIVGRAQRFDFDFPSMLRDVRALGAVLKVEASAATKQRAWMISPYAPAIDLIVEQWRKANPATSMNTQMGVGLRSGALKRFLEAYVIKHGRLPAGQHSIVDGPGTPLAVDFAALSPPQ